MRDLIYIYILKETLYNSLLFYEVKWNKYVYPFDIHLPGRMSAKREWWRTDGRLVRGYHTHLVADIISPSAPVTSRPSLCRNLSGKMSDRYWYQKGRSGIVVVYGALIYKNIIPYIHAYTRDNTIELRSPESLWRKIHEAKLKIGILYITYCINPKI